ncbi:EamA family transporter RarD [Amaricoccus sp.]|uniref:EamA family transporter RarD n=1 Tax=Amaricoccus sp. TaxID=1872485 RepID=UPI001B5D634C|nr:EamA family transporter RarD [Amaricoccus sp.]MBP7000094.1 EamA family transporter RarD [Amaricoccus sp.]
MSESARGLTAIVVACVIWGLSGIFFKALAEVPPLEVLSHRVVWTVIFVGLAIAAQGRLGEVAAAARRPRLVAALACTGILVAANWFGFISAVQAGRALEASLGYYVFPLIAVALGFVALGERFSALQGAAIALAALAVAVLTWGFGAPPWIALMLGTTFALYGLVKSRLGVGPVISVLIETGLLAGPALLWLVGLQAGVVADPGGRPGGFFGSGWRVTALLALSGPLMTGAPLILFSYAARRLRLATLGLTQYLNPTLQFLVATLVFGEAFTRWDAIAFPMIWAALALYSFEAWRRSRAAPGAAG